MAQERGGDGGDGLCRECRGGLLQSESPSDSAGRQTGFLIGEPIRQELTSYPQQRQTLRHWLSTCGAIAIVLPSLNNRTRRPAAVASEMGHKQSFPAALLSSSIPSDVAFVWFCSCFRRRPSLPEEIQHDAVSHCPRIERSC